MQARTIVYSALGAELEVFCVDVGTGALDRVQSLTMPARVQYAWSDRALAMLYVAMSDSGPMANPRRPDHFVQALRILPDGRVQALEGPVRLGNRPLYVTLDPEEQHLLLAYNNPPDVTVHRIAPDGGIGEQIEQPALAFGTTVHQVRVTPHGNVVLVPACGHSPDGSAPGSLNVFSFDGGRLAPLAQILPDPARAEAWRGVRLGAHGFAARHVTFHPTQPWMYLCVERQGEVHLHDYDEHGIALTPRAIRSTLEGAAGGRSMQLAGAIHVHPNGRFLYVSNRAWDAEDVDGEPVFVGGVNDVAVFAIDQTSGVPTLIQHAETFGFFPRTFGINAEGTLLVAGNEEARNARTEKGIERLVPSLVVYGIGSDGRLTLLNKHDHPDNGEICFWVGVVTLPAEE